MCVYFKSLIKKENNQRSLIVLFTYFTNQCPYIWIRKEPGSRRNSEAEEKNAIFENVFCILTDVIATRPLTFHSMFE